MIDQDNIKELDAILATHANQLKEYGEEEYRQFQKARFNRHF